MLRDLGQLSVDLRRADAVMIIEEFGRVLLEEMSYIQEAKNARRFAAQFAKSERVYVPQIYEEHSTDLVLVMEDVTGLRWKRDVKKKVFPMTRRNKELREAAFHWRLQRQNQMVQIYGLTRECRSQCVAHSSSRLG